jgi:YD repeat-containing protein
MDGPATRAAFDYDASGRLAGVRSHGRSLRLSYDDAGHVTSVSDTAGRSVSFAYTADGNLSQHTSADGRVAIYQYNDAGLLSSVAWAGGSTNITYTTDDIFVSVSSVVTADGSARAYDIPRSPREIRVTDANGNPTLYGNTGAGLLQSMTDASGVQTTYTYDSAGRRTRVTNGAGESTRFEYDAAGNPTAIIDGSGNRWTGDYQNGRPAHIADPKGNTWGFTYDSAASLTSVSAPNGGTATASRNASGAITTLNLYGITSTFQYDSDGLLVKAADSLGNTTAWQYEGAARVASRTDAGGNTIRADYGALLRPTGYSAGDTRNPVDASGIVRDSQGRVTSYTDSFGNQLTYTWDPVGRLARIGLPGDRFIAYDYDRAGRLSRVSDWVGNFALYRYDAGGYPASLNVSGGPITLYQYDAARNLKAIVSTGPDGGPVAGYRYTLDGSGNRTGISALEPSKGPASFSGSGFGYDAAGRPATRANGSSYRYDAAGNLAAIEGGPNLAFAFDPFGRLQSVSGDTSAAYAYDSLGLRNSRTVKGTTRRFVHDVSGSRPRIVMETDSGNVPVAYYVYGRSLLWKVTADGNPYFYHFDGDGNVVAVSNPTAGVVNRYRYDPLGVLISSDEGVENLFRARGAAGVADDGNGLLFADGRFVYPELRVELRGSIDLNPPTPELMPPLAPAASCLFVGIPDCSLASGGRIP